MTEKDITGAGVYMLIGILLIMLAIVIMSAGWDVTNLLNCDLVTNSTNMIDCLEA